jgi:hypothetical protein
MWKFILGIVSLLALGAPGANAALIASFSQNPSLTPTITATDNGTSTNIIAQNASTSITTGASGIIPDASFDLIAHSVDAAANVGAAVVQHFSGTFCFTSNPNCGGINYLSGIFSDAAFGALGGPGLTVNVNNPPDTLADFLVVPVNQGCTKTRS